MLEELLQALLQSSPGQQDAQIPKPSSSPENPWMDMLQGVLGGSPQESSQPTGTGGIGSLLEGFMGGGAQPNIGVNPLMSPFTEALSDKLGISPQMAAVIVSFAFSMIASSMQKRVNAANEDGIQQTPEEVINLDDLLDDDYLDSRGITEQLAKQTGLDQDTAKKSLKEAVILMSGQSHEREEVISSPPSQNGESLEHLLDTWED